MHKIFISKEDHKNFGVLIEEYKKQISLSRETKEHISALKGALHKAEIVEPVD